MLAASEIFSMEMSKTEALTQVRPFTIRILIIFKQILKAEAAAQVRPFTLRILKIFRQIFKTEACDIRNRSGRAGAGPKLTARTVGAAAGQARIPTQKRSITRKECVCSGTKRVCFHRAPAHRRPSAGPLPDHQNYSFFSGHVPRPPARPAPPRCPPQAFRKAAVGLHPKLCFAALPARPPAPPRPPQASRTAVGLHPKLCFAARPAHPPRPARPARRRPSARPLGCGSVRRAR